MNTSIYGNLLMTNCTIRVFQNQLDLSWPSNCFILREAASDGKTQPFWLAIMQQCLKNMLKWQRRRR